MASENLRKKAEDRVSKSGTQLTELPSAEVQKLLYEFQVHQIELELQNEELKNTQHELTVSRDQYKQLYNASPIGFLTLNSTGNIIKANTAAEKFLGASEKIMMGKKFGQFIDSSDQDTFYVFVQDILNTHTEQSLIIRLYSSAIKSTDMVCPGINHCNTTSEICINNDHASYLQCRGSYGVDESTEEQIFLSIFDVTAEKNAHETIACLNDKLEQKVFEQNNILNENNQALLNQIEKLKLYKRRIVDREAMLNSIFNAATEGIVTTQLSGLIVYVNDTVESIFGYQKQELVNCGINIRLIIPDTQKKTPKHGGFEFGHPSLFDANGKIKEVTGVRKDGTTLPLDISIAQFEVEEIEYLTIILRDATSRKLQEERAQTHLDELAHVTRLGLMGELASGIAHEVNQPLEAISAYCQACINLTEYKNYDQALLKEVLQKIYQQVLNAGQIIHRLRDFVKSKKIHRSTVEVHDVIDDAVSLCAAYLKYNNIHLSFNLPENLPTLSVDSVQIEQVILNLIKNSIDALKLNPNLMTRNLSIQAVINQKNEIEIRIKDNGPGIPLNEQQKIFTPFYTSKSEGMGMGLSICRSIIESHKGVLRFNSLPDKGTTFYFTLPVMGVANGG